MAHTTTSPTAPTKPLLSEDLKKQIRDLFPKYETKRAVLLPALHLVQETFNEVSDQAVVEIAALLELTPAAVLDTLTFYGYFWRHPRGKFVLTLCRSIACQVTGQPALYKHMKKRLGISDHETTPDGKFSIHMDECLAACDMAPCLQLNGENHGPLTVESLDKLLDGCK